MAIAKEFYGNWAVCNNDGTVIYFASCEQQARDDVKAINNIGCRPTTLALDGGNVPPKKDDTHPEVVSDKAAGSRHRK